MHQREHVGVEGDAVGIVEQEVMSSMLSTSCKAIPFIRCAYINKLFPPLGLTE